MAASVWSISFDRPSLTRKGRSVALMTPTLIVCRNPKGLPIAITQSPAAICDESPNFASGSVWSGFWVSWMSAVSVSASRPMTLAWCWSSSSPYRPRLVRPFDDVVVRQDEAILADDEPGSRDVSAATGLSVRVGAIVGSSSFWPGP
jgi:hypothetical protein